MKTMGQSFLYVACTVGIAPIGFSLLVGGGALLAQRPFPSPSGHGVLVFGPHPDDDVLGCSGAILQARARGEQVKVVLFTNGDADAEAAAGLAGKPADKAGVKDYMALSRSRQMQAKKALAVLKLKPDALILLGYPDAGLDSIYRQASAVPFTSSFTQMSQTYALVQRDYHAATHGVAAPYTRAAVLDDVVEIIRTFKPSQIYVTNEADGHPDHRAAFWFVRDAIKTAEYQGEFYTYLIHGEHGLQWPWPRGVTPELPFEPPHAVNDHQVKSTLPWPPGKRIFLTAAQSHLKLLAIRCHKMTILDPAQDADHEAYMESFVKSDEIFWRPAS